MVNQNVTVRATGIADSAPLSKKLIHFDPDVDFDGMDQYPV
jgi:hypothetical protein